jgi:hypothetical protein
MRAKVIQAPIMAVLLLLVLVLPQSVLANGVEISDVDAVGITSSTAVVKWTTNVTSGSLVNYGTTTTLGETKSDGSMVLDHYIPLTDLSADTVYYYEVWSGGVRSPADTEEYHFFTTSPQPEEYDIELDSACGVCGDLIDPEKLLCNEIIEATATVAQLGKYYICWDSRTAANVVATFEASGSGVYTVAFFMPVATKGKKSVYLTTDPAYAEKAKTEFEVLPSVKVDPEHGPVGTEVSLNGYGFGASQDIRVNLVQGEVTKGEEKTAEANGKGSWTLSYTVPHTPAGRYIFQVEGKEETPATWVNWVDKDFEVTPQITITPASGTVGQAINVVGTGFASEEEDIEITFDGDVRKENIFADADGSWTATITVPIRTVSRYIIDASGSATRARDVPDVTFTLVPGISVQPVSAYVGDTIAVKGGGFAPGETGIRVSLDGTSVATGTIVADDHGCWESSFSLPASAYGSHTVSASGQTTAAVSTSLSTLARITGLSPDEGAPGDSVTVTGDGFHGGQELTVTIGGIAVSGEIPNSASNGNVNVTFRVPKGSTAGERELVVADAGGATDSVDFTVTQKILSTVPLPISPKDSTLRSGRVTFVWQGVTGSTGYTYTLEIVGHWSKSGIEASTYTLTDTETVTESLGKGTYSWRVKLVDSYGNESPWSDSVEFKVSPIPTWVWVVVGLVVLLVLMVVAYRETKFRVTE